MRKLLLTTVGAVAFLASPISGGWSLGRAYAGEWANRASLKVFVGESVRDATIAINGHYTTDKVGVCGTMRTGENPWQCRQIIYLDGDACLILAFAMDASDRYWHLSNWGVDPGCE